MAQKGDPHSRCNAADGAKQQRPTDYVHSCLFHLHWRANFSKFCRVYFIFTVAHNTSPAVSHLRQFSVQFFRGDSEYFVPTLTDPGPRCQHHMDRSCRSSPRHSQWRTLSTEEKTSKLAKQDNAKAKYAASTAESVGAAGTDEAQQDVVTDGCLEAADTQMLAQACQVHRSSTLHPANALLCAN